MSPEFTMSPQTSVTSAVEAERTQLDRIESLLHDLLTAVRELESKVEKP